MSAATTRESGVGRMAARPSGAQTTRAQTTGAQTTGAQTTARSARTRRRTRGGRVLRMTRFEFGMILKQKVALMSIILAPALAIGMALLNRPTGPAAWMTLLASMSVLVLVLAVYNTTTSTVVARRETQVLKRLRTSELLPSQMLISLALPYVVVGVVQIAVVAAAYQAMGAPAMAEPVLFFAVVLATAVMGVLAGFATAAFAANSERVQFAVLPIMMIGLVASIFVLNPAAPDEYRALALLLPFAAPSDLAAKALGAPAEMFAVPAFVTDLSASVGLSGTTLMSLAGVAVTVLWCLIFAVAARRRWRWEPRG